jgi:hypothetical protein
MNNGSCLCGDISWKIDGDVTMHANCHCSICRKVHGSAYATFVFAPASAFSWTSGEDKIAFYQSSEQGQRGFCPHCGSPVPGVTGDVAFVPAGNLDGNISRPLDSHIFVGSKAPWIDINDDAPQFAGYPPGYDAVATDRPERPPATAGATGGSCDCGKVRYEFDGPPTRMGHCHCSRCRRARSAMFSTQLFVPAENFRWLAGEDEVSSYKVEGAKFFTSTFCKHCSSPMPRSIPEFNTVIIPAGSLDQDPGFRPQAHIFVGSKAPWLEISDDLPQFEEMPPQM